MEDYRRILSFGEELKFGYFQTLDHFIGRNRAFNWTRSQRTKYYNQLYSNLKKKGKGKIIEVDRVQNISTKNFKNHYLKRNIPVILEGKAKDWKSVQEWNIDYFIENYGNDEILVLADGYVNEKGVEKRDSYASTLEKELTDIKNGGSNYYRFYPLFQWHPERLKDIDLEFLKKLSSSNNFGDSFQTFIGAKGSFTGYHNASASNLFTQIIGEKEWYLTPNYYKPIIDPSPTNLGLFRSAPARTNQGCFNPFKPNYDSPYHLYEYIDQYHMILKPGDIFYNPPYYWHTVTNRSFSIGIGYRWYAPNRIVSSSKLYSFLDFFSGVWWNIGKARRNVNQSFKDKLKSK